MTQQILNFPFLNVVSHCLLVVGGLHFKPPCPHMAVLIREELDDLAEIKLALPEHLFVTFQMENISMTFLLVQ